MYGQGGGWAIAEFDLHHGNRLAAAITYGNGRIFVVDGAGNKVYAYRTDGEHDGTADFELHEDNDRTWGIAYANGLFYVADLDGKVYVYRDNRKPNADEIIASDEAIFASGARVSGLPSGYWSPTAIFGAVVEIVSADAIEVSLDDGGYIEVGGFRYTCRSGRGCEVSGGKVISGTLVRTASGVAWLNPRPSFAGGSRLGNLDYTVGAPIDTLRLPAADGGEGALAYTLEPPVPGLSFDPFTRRLAGEPSWPGTYDMTMSPLTPTATRRS